MSLVYFATLIVMLLLLIAALHDLAFRTVPNAIPAAVAGTGLMIQAASGHLAHAIIAGSIVFATASWLWHRGWLGGGDVKLLGAVSLAVAPLQVPSMLLSTALAGGILALPYLMMRRRKMEAAPGSRSDCHRPHSLPGRILRVESRRLHRGGPLPYALAIAAGVIIVTLQG